MRVERRGKEREKEGTNFEEVVEPDGSSSAEEEGKGEREVSESQRGRKEREMSLLGINLRDDRVNSLVVDGGVTESEEETRGIVSDETRRGRGGGDSPKKSVLEIGS